MFQADHYRRAWIVWLSRMSFIVSAISFYYSYAIYASVNATELLGIRVGGTNRVTDWPITRLELLLNDRVS